MIKCLVIDEGVGAFDVADGGEEIGGALAKEESEQGSPVVLIGRDLSRRPSASSGAPMNAIAHLQPIKNLAVPEEDIAIRRSEGLHRHLLPSHV